MWSHSTMQCVPLSCGPAPDIDHAFPETGHQLFGDIAIYYCTDGYSISGNSQLVCDASGAWTPPEGKAVPHCVADFCKKPPLAPHAILETIDKVKFPAGSQITYKCEEGFMLNTTTTIECVRGGLWEPSPFSVQCIPVRCAEPPVIERGHVSGTNYSFGAIVAYSCNKGFYVKGHKKRVCQADGEWSGQLPSCQPVSCGKPPSLTNGRVEIKNGTLFQSEVSYYCHHGFRLVGSPIRTCEGNRHWHSESPPLCIQVNCGLPPAPKHGHFIGSDFDLNSRVELRCEEGYVVSGNAIMICQEDGLWDRSGRPQCMPLRCPEPWSLGQDSNLLVHKTNTSGTILLECAEGYTLEGPASLKCLASQQWNDSFPVCQPVMCGKPPDVQYGDTLFSDLHFGSVAKYTCTNGFVLRGQPFLSCQADGTWGQAAPECVPIECPQPELIRDGIVDIQGLTYLSHAVYTCKPGFYLRGNATVTCGENGEWLGGRPVCQPVECPTPQEITNGRPIFEKLYHRETITYVCNTGFKLEGQEKLTCLETGEWDAEAPICKLFKCEPPQLIENGFVEGSDYSFGALIFYSCFPGFHLIGTSMRICEETSWSNTSPYCVPVDCGLPPHIDFGGYLGIRNEDGDVDGGSEKRSGSDIATNLLPSGLDPKKGFSASISEQVPHLSSSDNKQMWNNPSVDLHQTSGFTSGTVIQYYCYSSYELIGYHVLECQEDGTWNGSAPACLLIECKLPVKPENGHVRFSSNLLGSMIEYSCDRGYELLGSHTRRCTSNSEWNGTPPTCQPVSCDSPSQIKNGVAKGTNYTYTSVIAYDCDPGFELVGPVQRTCQSNGEWSGEVPQCVPVSCGLPPSPDNGNVTGLNYTFQSLASYSCNNGYLIKGDLIRTCLANGSWSGETPQCLLAACPPLTGLPNGYITGSEFTYRKEVQFQCVDGYLLVGAPSLVCQGDGSWSDVVPQCSPVNCGPPEDISHGLINGSSFSFGDSVKYICFRGYGLIGISVRYCLRNGSWSDNVPKCEPCSCPYPNIHNGFTTDQDFSCGNLITFQCMEGFKLLGSSQVLCESGGRWNSSLPYCGRISCGAPPLIHNAFFNGSSSLPENAIAYNCFPGYIMKGKAEVFCTDRGKWSQPYPTCGPVVCGPPPPVQHATVVGDQYTFGSRIHYRCSEGYIMGSETDSQTCLEDGSWSTHSIECKPQSCTLPFNARPNVVISGTLFTVNESIIISCEEGYQLSGANKSTCQVDGFWSPPISDILCSPVSCEEPLPPVNGSVKGTSYEYKDSVTYQCDIGYELQGSTQRFCQEDGTWNGTQASCRRITCEPHPLVENALAIEVEDTYMSTISFVCDFGYHLIGPENITCLANRTWSQPLPRCEAKQCTAPPNIPEGIILSDTVFHVNQKVSLHCQKGFRLLGNSSIMCGPDLTWSPITATCEKISCGDPAQIPNGFVQGVLHNHVGDIATYSCYSGHMLIGHRTSSCLQNGTWSPPPICQAVCRFPCQNGGVCNRPNTCTCPDGWMGRLCETPICILPCLNGGLCSAPYQCDCPPGWTGSRCHHAVCQTPCLNGGRCIRPNRCQCLPIWSGSDCSRRRKSSYFTFS